MTEPIVTMNTYPSNSDKSKAARATEEGEEAADSGRPKPERITTGDVIQRKKPLGRKFMETFFNGDDIGTVTQYAFGEVMVPALKTMVSDAVREVVERTLFGGGSGGNRPRTYAGNRPHTSYNAYYANGSNTTYNAGNSQQRDEPRTMSNRGRATHNFREVIFATRPEATEVLKGLEERIHEYAEAQVDDFYSMTGITGNYQDTQWGWRDLGRGEIRRVREGYILMLPQPIPLG